MVVDARPWWRRTVHGVRTVHGRCACARIAGGGGQRTAMLLTWRVLRRRHPAPFMVRGGGFVSAWSLPMRRVGPAPIARIAPNVLEKLRRSEAARPSRTYRMVRRSERNG